MVFPFDATQDQHWLRKMPSTHARFVNTARSHASQSAFGPAESVDTLSLVALGNHSPVLLTQTTEFYDAP